MNKSDLIGRIADTANVSRATAGAVVESTLDVITSALQSGEEVSIIGFGKFSISHSKARTGRNPRDGSPIQIPASNQVNFKAGKGLKDAVN